MNENSSWGCMFEILVVLAIVSLFIAFDAKELEGARQILVLLAIALPAIGSLYYKWSQKSEPKRVSANYKRDNSPKIKGPVDPALHDYIQKRQLKGNGQVDFRNDPEGKIRFIETPKGLHQQLGDNPEYFAFSPSGKHGYKYWKLPNGDELQVAHGGYKREYESSYYGVLLNKDQVLIYPYFKDIRIHQKQNVIECITKRDNDGLEGGVPYADDHYYFDAKGRFLGKDLAALEWNLPAFALDDIDSTEPIRVEPVPRGFNVISITPKVYLAYNYVQTGLFDHTGKVLVPLDRNKYVYHHGAKFLFIESGGAVLKISIPEIEITQLPYQSILGTLWITGIHFHMQLLADVGQDRPKCALVNMEGEELMPPIYDYITLTADKDRFKVYNSETGFGWSESDEAYDVFELIYDSKKGWDSHFNVTEDDYMNELNKGTWGILDETGKVIIPAEYDWVEEVEGLQRGGFIYYLLNKGGKVFGLEAGHSTDQAYVRGGVWGICDEHGNMIAEPTDETNPLELLKKHTSPYDHRTLLENLDDLVYVTWKGQVEAR